MSANDQQIFEIIGQVDSGKIKRDLACSLLGISPRTLTRYLAGYRSSGLMFLKHGNRGRKPANTHPYEMKAAVGKIMLEVLFDFNMMHARDLVEERLGLKIPRETFRRWCHEFKTVKRGYRKRSKIRMKRTRQSQMGLIVQFDGSNHLWFGDEKSVLIAGIDDATSEVLWAGFYDSENVLDCMDVLKEIIKKFGVFRMLYVDRAGLYGGIKRRGFSQITRALKELGTGVIYAQSPEGKGRVERLFRTLQDRLIPELRLNGIKTRELANRYLRDIYIKDHNRRFAVKSENEESGFVALDPKINLESIFCIKEQRTVGKDHTVSIKAERYKVNPKEGISLAGRRIEVRPDGPNGPEAYALGQQLDLEKIKPDRKQSEKDNIAG